MVAAWAGSCTLGNTGFGVSIPSFKVWYCGLHQYAELNLSTQQALAAMADLAPAESIVLNKM